ncbi:MAG: endonuclease III [Clostridia bacterium]|nr:endonuclease III [Clostridia bacterium]
MEKNVRIISALRKMHDNPVCELNYSSPFELLVAVILSAQCTDKRVNLITPALFEAFSCAKDIANLNADELIPYIKSCGFYNNKAKSIISASKALVERFNGKVPATIEELTTLDGVGRKTANVIYSVAFGGNAIAVDTHVFRVSRRIGIAKTNTADSVERELQQFFPEAVWSEAHHLLIHHGRYICMARKPVCSECLLNKECEYYSRKENE